MNNSYFRALMAASLAGADKGQPRITVEMCAPCKGIKLRCTHEGYHVEHIVGWDDYLASNAPTSLLLDTIAQIRQAMLARVFA